MDSISSTQPDGVTAKTGRTTPDKKARGKKRRLPGLAKWLIAIVLLATVALGVFLWRNPFNASAAQQPSIILPVTQGNLNVTVESNGKVEATHQESVTYQTAGHVVEVLVKSGDSVKAGQPLVRQTDQDQKAAVAEAQAALNTAQSKYNDLKKGASEASIASAQADVQSAQAALDTLKAGSSKTDIADAQSDLRTAEANLSVVKAGATAKDIKDTEADLATAQTAYQTLKAGATPKDIADAQTTLAAAQANYQVVAAGATKKEITDAEADLAAAQAKYDALVAPPSASDLKAAQSELTSAQLKLAALKAGPTQAELSKAQLAVTQATSALKKVQTDAALSKQEKELAVAKAVRDLGTAQRAYGSIADQVLNEKGELVVDASSAQYEKYWTAFNALKDAEAAVTQAQADLDSVRQQEINDTAEAQATLDDANKQLQVVQAGPTESDLADAQLAVDTAQKALDDLNAGSAKDTVATAQAAVVKAQTALDELKAGPTKDKLAAAQADVDKAQTALDQLKAGPTADDLAKANADVVKAQTALDELKAGPTQDKVATAQTTVDKARSKLTALLAGPTADEIAAAQATVAQKQSSLAALLEPASASDLSAAEESVATAQKALDDANADLAKTVLTAPLSGIVASVTAEPNANISVGTEALSIYDPSGMHLELAVNESDIGKIKSGEPSAITIDALPGAVLTGTVSTVSNVATTNQDVVTYQVDVQFDPAAHPIKTGMSANATITVESHEGVIQVPTRAITSQGRNKVVKLLYGDSQTPIPVEVVTGASNSQMTEITSCVETNNQCLREGDRVSVTIATSTTTGNNAAPGFGVQFGGGFGGGQFTPRQGTTRDRQP